MTIPNADLDIFIADSITYPIISGNFLEGGALVESASKESSSLNLESAIRILESGRREDDGMVASKRVVVVEGTMVHHARRWLTVIGSA